MMMRRIATLFILIALFCCSSNRNAKIMTEDISGIIYLEKDEPGIKKKATIRSDLTLAKKLKKEKKKEKDNVRDFKKDDGIIFLGVEDQVKEIPGEPFKPSFSPQYGKASYYGEKFHGRRTASGEIYDQYKLTAAHPTLKFGTKVRVTNLFNNKSVIVQINDRGPFTKSRIIDLSYAAAVKLDMIKNGVVEVLVEVIDKP